MDILMLVTNDVRRDPRVQKEARTLSAAGHSVGVVGITWSEPSDWQTFEGGYRVKLVQPGGPVRDVVKRKMKAAAPDVYEQLIGMYRKARGIQPAAPRPATSTTAPDAPVVDRDAQIREGLRQGLLTKDAKTKALVQAGIVARPQIVHAHDLDTLKAASVIARTVGAGLVFDSHEIYWQQHAPNQVPPEWTAYYRDLEAELMPQTDRVITVCDSIADFLYAHHDIERPVVLRNAIEVPQGGFQSENSDRETVAPVKVLYHGGFAPDRGLEELIEAAQYFENCTLTLRGFGNLEGYLRDKAKEFGIVDKVEFSPPVPMNEVVSAASASDIGVIPYKPVCLNNRYSTPNKLFEYLSAGVAVAASDIPEIRKIIDADELGAVFDPYDPKSIAEAVNALAKDPAEVTRMRRRSLAVAAEKHNWDVEKPKLIELYRQLLPRRWSQRVLRTTLGK